MYTLILEANSLPICYTDVNNEMTNYIWFNIF